MRVAVSEVYRCHPDGEALRLIQEFAEMVKWWVDRAETFPGGPHTKFRKAHYKAWTERWSGWNRQHLQSSMMLVYSTLRLWKEPNMRRRGVEAKLPLAVLHPKTVKVVEGMLRIATTRNQYGYVKLTPNSPHQQNLLRQAENGLWQNGQVIITPDWAIIPFAADLDLAEEGQPLITALLQT